MSEQLPSIFDDLDGPVVASALRHFRKVAVDFGTVLMEEGDEDPSMICLLAGEVEVRTGKVELGKAGPGELIGEMALFGDGLRTATVRTTSTSSFLILDRSGYEALRSDGHPVAMRLEQLALSQLNARLRDINARISRLAEGTSAAVATPSASIFSRVARLFGGGGGRSRASGIDALAVLQKSPLFASASPGALKELAGHMSPVAFAAGHFLCTQGDYGREMFVLAEGEVEVLIALDQERVEPLATLDPGDAFGTVALLEDLPRMASCVAKGGVKALALDRQVFERLVDTPTDAGAVLRSSVIKALVDQLAYANGQLAMLDIEHRQRSGQYIAPLLRANAGMEAHGRHLHDPEQVG